MKKDSNKKIICKKNRKKKKQVTGVHRHTQEKIEKNFFFGFCDFMTFFGIFGFIFGSTLLENQILFRSQLLLSNILRIRY